MEIISPALKGNVIEPLEEGCKETTTSQGTTYRFNNEFEEVIKNAIGIPEGNIEHTPVEDLVTSKETSKDYFLERSISPFVSPKVRVVKIPYTLDKDGNRHIDPTEFENLTRIQRKSLKGQIMNCWNTLW